MGSRKNTQATQLGKVCVKRLRESPRIVCRPAAFRYDASSSVLLTMSNRDVRAGVSCSVLFARANMGFRTCCRETVLGIRWAENFLLQNFKLEESNSGKFRTH